MDIIENYEKSIQNLKEYFSIPSEWEVTFNIYKACYWEIPMHELIFYYVSIEDYIKDEYSLTEQENSFILPITSEKKWYKVEDIPANYTGRFEGEKYTAFLIDDDQYPEDLVFAIFENDKSLDFLNEHDKIDAEEILKSISIIK